MVVWQQRVNAYFRRESSYWTNIYRSPAVEGEIYRDREAAVLDLVDRLGLPPGCRVLEVGCGAGYLSLGLIDRGFQVGAVDSSEAMVELARRHATEAGVESGLDFHVDDVNALRFEDGSFDLVVAVGVLPWLERVDSALHEMARVTRRGGYVIVTADNQLRLNHLFDPRMNPLVRPAKRFLKHAIQSAGFQPWASDAMGARFDSPGFIDRSLRDAGFAKVDARTVGFGPFSLGGRVVIPQSLGATLHHRLQRLADRSVPVFRSCGAHYIVLGRKDDV